MRTIFSAMLWDTLYRGRWVLPIGFLGGNVLNIFLFQPTIGRGIDIAREPEFVLGHLLVAPVNMLIFSAVIMLAQGKPDWLFTHPVTNRTLTAYYMLISSGLLFAQSVLSTLLMNGL